MDVKSNCDRNVIFMQTRCYMQIFIVLYENIGTFPNYFILHTYI